MEGSSKVAPDTELEGGSREDRRLEEGIGEAVVRQRGEATLKKTGG